MNGYNEKTVGYASILDAVVKYAVVVTWVAGAAGFMEITTFLSALHVPMDIEFFAFPIVLSHGGVAIWAVVFPSVICLLLFYSWQPKSKTHSKNAIWVPWIFPVLPVVISILREQGSFFSRLHSGGFLLVGIYAVMLLVTKKWFAESREGQLLLVFILLSAIIQGATLTGHFDAEQAKTSSPSVKFLLSPEAVAGASELGLKFSTKAAPGLSDPVNVVAFTDKTYYLWVPVSLSAETQGNGINLKWDGKVKTVALPKDRVILAEALNGPL